MKIRQTYQSGGDKVCVQFTYDNQLLITGLKEVNSKSKMEAGEYILPRVEVTEECFFKIINNFKLK